MFYVGQRVRIVANSAVGLDHDYSGHTGTVAHVYAKHYAVQIDSCNADGSMCGGYNFLGFYLHHIEVITNLQDGYGYCKCGAVTSRGLFSGSGQAYMCCECRSSE